MAETNRIANRYEVFQHIGQGGMADVFLAVDTILNRQVAVKILRAELSSDPVSVLRFEREAQAATALSHPNIVEIYDVGEYKGHHYIVMEYVPGKSLKKVIQNRGGLPKEEAIDIGKQLCSAVAEAHRRGVIHRDIKPQNIIVKSDGSIKILDFGIAIAKGSIQLTQANNVMGSVHYLAPELAKGDPATPQSDIYAIGICLFEMLTGDVPFKADQAVQVALMQLHNEMPSVRSINPNVPQSLENVIIKATAKDPRNRYRSASEMLEDLRTCLRPEREYEQKLVLHDAKSDLEKEVEEDLQHPRKTRHTEKKSEARESRVVNSAIEKKRRTSPLFVILIVLLLLLGASGVYFALSLSGRFQKEPDTITVPSITGMSLTDAKLLCDENNLVLDTSNVEYTLTTDTEKGLILTVEPGEGSEVEAGTRITVTVSSGIGITMPNFVGETISQAQEELSQYQYIRVTTQEEESDATPGTVIRQEKMEAGTMFNPETADEILLVYASYPTVTIPEEIVGMSIEDATSTLEALGIEVYQSNLDTSGLTETEIANLNTGVVIRSEPDAGSEYTQRDDNAVILYYY